MRISKETILRSRFINWLEDLAKSSIIAKTIITIIIWLGALIPVWLYLIVRWLIDPVTFWQEFAIFCVFAIGIGWLQVILGVFGFMITLLVIAEDL